MKTISPPGALLTEVAQGLLASARALGHPADVVATTSGAEFGNGFVVPDDVFDHWLLGRAEKVAPETLKALREAYEPAEPESQVAPEPKKKGRGVKPSATDETGA